MDGVDFQALALEALPKALVYAAVIVALGAAAARQLFVRRVAPHLPPEPSQAVPVSMATSFAVDQPPHAFERALARVAVSAAGWLLVGLLLRAWGHTAVSFGVADAFSSENLRTIAWDSQWAEGWRLQMAGAVALLICSWAIGQLGAAGWQLTALAASATGALLTLTGHAAGEPPKMLMHAAHIVGAGVWVGTLIATAVAARGPVREAMLRAFAPYAFAGSAALIVTGGLAALTYIGSLTNLVSTPYGWALLLKLIFVADVATFGFLNWRRFHGGGAAGPGNRDMFVVLEVVMASLVILVTAVLTELEHPV